MDGVQLLILYVDKINIHYAKKKWENREELSICKGQIDHQAVPLKTEQPNPNSISLECN